jgi:hypothetical protein
MNRNWTAGPFSILKIQNAKLACASKCKMQNGQDMVRLTQGLAFGKLFLFTDSGFFLTGLTT